ncbi:MAG TPA: T9SS type A sorting domain-containing protein, partial [Candidatus Krumholzibacteria bacterium]|nr:T9SS type A sorting domain-containing protein [Candidatus Krumholzibacteria bacterium]
ANGVSLCNAGGGQGLPRILADGAGGAFVAWVDTRNSDNDIFAQRVNSAGVAQWTTDGVPVVVYATYTQTNPLLVSDGAGGAIVTWEDYRASNADLYAQRLSATGFRMWQPLTGVPVVAVANAQTHATVASDNAGGVIVAWDDARIGSDADIYAQRLNNQGVARWTANGVALSKPLFDQLSPCVSLNGTGAIVGWNDIRNGNDYDIYAARVDIEEGYVGHPEPQIVSVADVKADQGGHVKVNWTASGWDVRHLNTIDHYSIWRAVDAGAFQSAMRAGAVSDLAKIGADFHGSAVRKQTGPNQTSYYWEWVGNQNILYANGYSFSAETRADSTSQSPATHYFQVVSHTANPYLFWPSNVVSGRSVDNLAPIAPLALTAQRIGSYVYLKWNGVHLPDLKKYTVYRKTSTGVTAVPGNFLSDATDTLLTDSSAPASALYYVVTASDVHENQGSASNEANVAAATGVGNLPPLAALQVLQNRPNPFAGATDLQIGLPTASKVDIAVYDIAGRRVRTITINETAAGWKSVPFDARNDAGEPLASGVYFCRVSAAGKTVTHKMVIAH